MKKKLLLTFLSVLMCFGVMLSFSTHNNFASAADAETYSITFVTNGSGSIPSQNYAQGDDLILPTPQREGYIFLGWYNDAQCSEPFTGIRMPSRNLTLYAKWNFIFTISNSGSGVRVSSNRTQTSTHSSMEEAINSVTNVSLNTLAVDTAYLYFDNFNLDLVRDEYIYLPSSQLSYHFSGTISSSSSNALVKLENEYPAYLTVENITLNCENSTYSIETSSTGNTLNFGGEIQYSSTFFTNFSSGNNLNASQLKLDSAITITVPYLTLRQDIVYFNNVLSQEFVRLSSENSSYRVDYSYYRDYETLRATAYINVIFDANDGQIVNNKFNNYSFNYSSIITLPTENDFSKNYSFFNGLFGKIEYNSVTYYFDAKMLENFSAADYDFEIISNYFVTDLDQVDTNYAFTNFNNSSSETDFAQYAHIHFFMQNGYTPTYIVKWSYHSYGITLNTNFEDIVYDTIQIEYGKEITLPTPEKDGYTFAGWFRDANLREEFNLTIMPAYNIEAFAKWYIKSYTISYVLNGGTIYGTTSYSSSFNFGQDVTTPTSTPSKLGYRFLGWFEDENLTTPFEVTTMPSKNLTAYAKWEIIQVRVTLNTSGGIFNGKRDFTINYGETIDRPTEDPVRTGYTFIGWYDSLSSNTQFDFSRSFTVNTTIYAKWTINSYTLSYQTNYPETISPITLEFQQSLVYPLSLSYSSHIFVGWFLDEEFLVPITEFDVMPNWDITIYAKWIDKDKISLSVEPKDFLYDKDVAVYRVTSKLDGFNVYYLVNDEWTLRSPTEIGSYDVKITRYEDANYCAYEEVFKGIINIKPVQRDFSWLIIVFYFLTAAEIATILFVKRIRVMKRSRNYAVIFGTWFISTSQFVHIIISGAIFLIGFIWLFYELLRTHRTANNENFRNADNDLRERFKEDLKFQINVKANPYYEYETKTKESFGDKYSSEDIERMLINDTYNEDRLKEKAKNGQNVYEVDETSEPEFEQNYSANDLDDGDNDDFSNTEELPVNDNNSEDQISQDDDYFEETNLETEDDIDDESKNKTQNDDD